MMIYVGIDDTDTIDDPGTNQLARLMVRVLAGQARGRMILRHQLLEDPRVPCTKTNGCASLAFEPLASFSHDGFLASVRKMVVSCSPQGSDPGLCVTRNVPQGVA